MGLGFSSGLPLLLIYSTLSARLTDAGIARAQIGAFAWIGLLLGVKFLWAPVVDRLTLPGTNTFGARRAWIVWMQIALAAAFVAVSAIDPSSQLWLLVVAVFFVVFLSATQDIAVDAYRIERVSLRDQNEAIPLFAYGYRTGMFLAGSGALALAHVWGWQNTYLVMAVCQLLCVAIPVFAKSAPKLTVADKAEFGSAAWLRPAHELWQRLGNSTMLTLVLFLLLFRLCDSMLGMMWTPYLLGLGYDKLTIAAASGPLGVGCTLLGAAFGARLAQHIEIRTQMLIAAVLAGATNLLLPSLSYIDLNPAWLASVCALDAIGNGFASFVVLKLIAQLINREFSASQHAFFAALPFLSGRMVAGPSGWIVDQIGFEAFFWASAATCLLPILVLRMRSFASITDASWAMKASADT